MCILYLYYTHAHHPPTHMSSRPVSLWTFGGKSRRFFNDMEIAIAMIHQTCRDAYLLVVHKNGLEVTPHSILGQSVPDEVKAQTVPPAFIADAYPVDRYDYSIMHDAPNNSKISAKKFLKSVYKKFKKKHPGETSIESFITNWYFHYTCRDRLEAISEQGLVSAAEPTIDRIMGGRRRRRTKPRPTRPRRRTTRRRARKSVTRRRAKQSRRAAEKRKLHPLTRKNRVSRGRYL